MITLREAISASGQSLTAVASAIGVSAAQMSRVATHDYKDWEQKERELVEAMVRQGLLSKDDAMLEQTRRPTGQLFLDPAKFVVTANSMELDGVAKDLLDPATTLNASIGVVYGRAGYGKTTAIKHFCATNPKAIYILFVEGYTMNMMMKAIAREFGQVPCGTFDRNLDLIRQATAVYRRLICIDEADHMPLKVLETIRGINEVCGVPVLLVGEYGLQAKMGALPRLESRIRARPVEFTPLQLMDVVSYYQQAVGIDLSGDDKVAKALLKRSHGDFRLLANDAHQLVNIMNANGVRDITKEVLDALR